MSVFRTQWPGWALALWWKVESVTVVIKVPRGWEKSWPTGRWQCSPLITLSLCFFCCPFLYPSRPPTPLLLSFLPCCSLCFVLPNVFPPPSSSPLWLSGILPLTFSFSLLSFHLLISLPLVWRQEQTITFIELIHQNGDKVYKNFIHMFLILQLDTDGQDDLASKRWSFPKAPCVPVWSLDWEQHCGQRW